MSVARERWRPVTGGYEVGATDEDVRFVFIPGIRGVPEEFGPLAAVLAGRHRLLSLPPVGETLSDIGRYLLADLADLPGPLSIVTGSFGGLVARTFPPARVARLTLIGTLPRRGPAATRAGYIGRLLPLLPGPLYRRLYRKHAQKADAIDGQAALSLPFPPRDVLAQRLRAIAAWDIPDTLPGPTDLIWGRRDPFATWTEAEVIAAGMTPRQVPGGHFPHLSQPGDVARVLWG